MRKSIFKLLYAVSALLYSCKDQKQQFIIHKTYYYSAEDSSQVFEVNFTDVKDTTYVSYTLVLNNGNLIDGTDSLDFAGYFFKKNIKNNEIKFKIRDYVLDPPEVGDTTNSPLFYNVGIKFLSDSSFRWHIDTAQYGTLPRLPAYVILKQDKANKAK